MIIGIDASRAIKQQRTGTENYSYELLRELVKVDPTTDFRLYAPQKLEALNAPNVNWQILPAQRLWSQNVLAKELRRNKPDVLFVPSHVVPWLSHLLTVVTIHGLEYRKSPESYSPKERWYLNASTKISLRKAKKVIVPSLATKTDIIANYHTASDKIKVIPEGYNNTTFHLGAGESERPIAEPYFFFVGRLEKRKNISLLIEAFELLAKEKTRTKLVLAGKPGYGHEHIAQQLSNLKPEIRNAIILPGYISTEQLVTYLRHASAFVFPSLYEGFGLPILEAMAMGAPIICSDTPSLSEIAGESGVILPPTNPLAWASAMSRIIHQPNFAEELRQKGLKQVQSFSWKKAAEQTLAVLLDAKQ